MGDWIDDLLQQGEKLPGIGDAIQKLQMVYDIWRNEPANPQPTRDQANNLNDLFQQAQQLRDHFNESLSNLRQKWSGNDAQVYLGPEVTAFEIEHAMEPGTTGTGYQLWNLLNQTTALLNYNAAAHDVGADKLQQIQEFHDELNTDFMIALGTLGMMLATAPIPGVDVVTDSVGAGAEIAEAGVAADDAIQLSRFMKLLKTVEDVVQDVTKVVKIYLPLIQFLAKAGAIATIATVTLLVLASIPSDSSLTNGNLNPPGPLSPEQQEMLERLARDYPDIPPDVLRELVTSGLTEEQIRALLKKFGIDAIVQLVQRWEAQAPGILHSLYQARDIPGIERLLKDLITGAQLTALGSLYQLSWIVQHIDEIERIEDTDADGNKAADVILKDGKGIVDFKYIDWSRYNSFVLKQEIKKLEAQAKRDKELYPGKPITFCFDSQFGEVPQEVKDALKELGVTVITWP